MTEKECIILFFISIRIEAFMLNFVVFIVIA